MSASSGSECLSIATLMFVLGFGWLWLGLGFMFQRTGAWLLNWLRVTAVLRTFWQTFCRGLSCYADWFSVMGQAGCPTEQLQRLQSSEWGFKSGKGDIFLADLQGFPSHLLYNFWGCTSHLSLVKLYLNMSWIWSANHCTFTVNVFPVCGAPSHMRQILPSFSMFLNWWQFTFSHFLKRKLNKNLHAKIYMAHAQYALFLHCQK